VTEPGASRAEAAGGRERLRAAHADRERVVEVLKAAFVQGRLDKDELDARVGRAFASRTYAELAALTADIPAEPAPRQPARVPSQTLPSQTLPSRTLPSQMLRSHPIRNGAIGVGASLTVAAASLWGALILQNQTGLLLVILAGLLVMFGVPLIIWAAADTAREQRRARRQLPPRPGPDGRVSGGQRDTATGRDRARPGARPDWTQTEMRTHASRARRAIRLVPPGHPA
jgi:hypothetical protein